MVKTIGYEKARKQRLIAGAKVLAARTKQIKEELKASKFAAKQKEKSAKKWQELSKTLSKKVVSKKILRPNKMSVHIREREIEPVLEDANRYFKGEMEDMKKQMFFS